MIFLSFRSQSCGNCLFSSISILLYGDNSAVEYLRALTAIKLYLFADYYCKHPLFSEVLKEHPKSFKNVEAILKVFQHHHMKQV